MTWLKIVSEDINYDSIFPVEGTDASADQDVGSHALPPKIRTNTPDRYDQFGRSIDKAIPGGSTTITLEEQPLAEHERVHFRNPMQPSSQPSRDTWDSPGSTAPEGERPGQEGSAIYGSGISIQVTLHGKGSYDPAGWSFNRAAAFGEFIDDAPATLIKYRRCGMQRESAVAALNKVYSALFQTTPWVTQLATRFLDQVYGTTKRAKCEAQSVAESMSGMVDEAYAKGMPKEAALERISDEFSAWLDNSPGTGLYLQACLERKYGIKLGPEAQIEQYQKIKLINNPDAVGIVLQVSETADRLLASIFWLSAPAATPDEVPVEEIALLGPASPEEIRLANDQTYGTLHTNSLVIRKSAGTYYLNLLLDQNPVLPIEYSDFRKWCATKSIYGDLFRNLERTAVEMNFIRIPDSITIEAVATMEAPTGNVIKKTIKGQEYTFDVLPVHDLEANTIPEYKLTPRELPGTELTIPNPSGKPMSWALLEDALYNLLPNPVFAAQDILYVNPDDKSKTKVLKNVEDDAPVEITTPEGTKLKKATTP